MVAKSCQATPSLSQGLVFGRPCLALLSAPGHPCLLITRVAQSCAPCLLSLLSFLVFPAGPPVLGQIKQSSAHLLWKVWEAWVDAKRALGGVLSSFLGLHLLGWSSLVPRLGQASPHLFILLVPSRSIAFFFLALC